MHVSVENYKQNQNSDHRSLRLSNLFSGSFWKSLLEVCHRSLSLAWLTDKVQLNSVGCLGCAERVKAFIDRWQRVCKWSFLYPRSVHLVPAFQISTSEDFMFQTWRSKTFWGISGIWFAFCYIYQIQSCIHVLVMDPFLQIYIFFSFCYILAGTCPPPPPSYQEIREFSCWNSHCQHQFRSVNFVSLTPIQHSCWVFLVVF